ncbi:hypothetical protein Zmor_014623 [Zophobas morio]|uniref:THAP-type domain-containing protein n=1 Tax=Zophobas morio TaxID=2755281 RepID=A0AA38MGL9_9CUCU|nr:hypothetical protein Zmor_014623 [Zophobas morio]
MLGFTTLVNNLLVIQPVIERLPTDTNLREEWIKALNLVGLALPKFTYVCSKHFSNTCFVLYPSTRKKGLKKGSVPRLHPIKPRVDVHELSTAEEQSNVNAPSTALLMPGEIPSTSKGERGEKQSSSTVTATESDNGRTSIMRVAKRTHTSSSTLTASETERVLGTRGSFATPTKRRKIINKRYMGDWSSEATITPKKAGVQLRMAKQQLQKQSRQIRNLQQAKRRLKANIFSMKSMLKFFREKNFISSQAEDVIKTTQPDESGEIIRRFLRGPSKAKYSPALRAFALTLHFFSAKAYNYIRQKFNKTLPHPRTLSKWYYTIDGSPGFTEESKRALAAKVEETNGKSQILCNLVMDEMAIKRKIEWDGKKFTGYVNIGVELSSDELAEAKEALVFMLVALNGSWKIPIGYFLLEGLSAMEKANLVVKGLEFVHPTGVIVTSLTFDGTPTNLSMAEYLGADFKNYMVPPSNF